MVQVHHSFLILQKSKFEIMEILSLFTPFYTNVDVFGVYLITTGAGWIGMIPPWTMLLVTWVAKVVEMRKASPGTWPATPWSQDDSDCLPEI